MSSSLNLAHDIHPPRQADLSLDQPMIILHGLFGSSGNWRSIARRFADRRSVICLDLRNHGKSPWAREMDYETMASDVANFIQQHSLKKPILVGHSMGGKTVMKMLLNNLVPVSKAIVLDIAPVGYAHDHLELLDAMRNTSIRDAANRSDVDQLLARSIEDPSLRAFLAQNAVRSGDGFQWRVNLNSIHTNMSKLLDFDRKDKVSSTPTLFLGGGESDYMLPKYHQEIRTAFPKAQIDMLDGAGHWLHAEKPTELIERMSGFLSTPETEV